MGSVRPFGKNLNVIRRRPAPVSHPRGISPAIHPISCVNLGPLGGHTLQLQFLGANQQVTGSRYLLEAAGQRVLIDCGLFQEREFRDRNWAPSPQAWRALSITFCIAPASN